MSNNVEKKNRMVIVDSGKNAVKVMTFSGTDLDKFKVLTFPSISKKRRIKSRHNPDSSTKHFEVEIDNSVWEIGEGVESTYNLSRGKDNPHHILCIYLGIALSVTRKNEVIDLVVGYPSTDFDNEESVNEFKDMILGKNKGAIELKLNGKNKSFKINSISIEPEGQALLPRLLINDRIRERGCSVIDIGGENVNVRRYDANGNNLQSFSYDKAGMNHIANALFVQFRTYFANQNVDFDSVDYMKVIRDMEYPYKLTVGDEYDNDMEEFIYNSVLDAVDASIFTNLMRNQIDLSQQSVPIIFTGGGSLALSSYIIGEFEDNQDSFFFSPSSTWDNCISYAMRGFNKHLTKAQAQKTQLKVLGKLNAALQDADFEKKNALVRDKVDILDHKLK